MENADRLYFFYIIDGRGNKDQEGEQMIKSFITKGHKLDNLYIFTSPASIAEINDFLKEHKMKDFMYLLVDMTDNVTTETFKTVVNEDYYRPAEKLIALLKNFKKDEKAEATEPTSLTDYQTLVDNILDQVSQKGEKSLSQKQRQILEDFSKRSQNKTPKS